MHYTIHKVHPRNPRNRILSYLRNMFRVLNGQTGISLSYFTCQRTGYFTMKMARRITIRGIVTRNRETMTSHGQAGRKEKRISPLWRKWVQSIGRLLVAKTDWNDLGVSGVVAFHWLSRHSGSLVRLLP